jgi:hypothetical protein
MKIILVAILFLTIALAIARSYIRGHHRHGYGRSKRRVGSFVKTETDTQVYGDWPATPSRSRREAEPRGM